MNARIVCAALLVLAAACSRRPEERSPMPGMTAEEHARMQAGATTVPDTGGAQARQAVHLTPQQERALGVTYVTVRRQPLTRTVRTVGEIMAAEPRIADVTPKTEGFVEALHVGTTGAEVRRGEPLLALYSPALVAAQEELLTARRLVAEVESSGGEAARNAAATLAGARRRLELWDVTPEEIARLETTGEVRKTLTLVSPVTGVVLEKDVVQGQQVMPGMRLYRIADLSEVWVEGELFEQDLKLVQPGAQAHIEVAAYPGQHLMGRVAFVYPTVDTESRTNRVRVTVRNPDRRLKPGMFATMYFNVTVGDDVIVIPMEAIVVTGERTLVFVRDSAGVLSPRPIVLGVRTDHEAQVLAGLREGEQVVASANFLVDAESRLANTGGGMPGTQHGAVEPDSQRRPAGPEHRHD
jgi:membrane fusion protein, copper/silver efflux system